MDISEDKKVWKRTRIITPKTSVYGARIPAFSKVLMCMEREYFGEFFPAEDTYYYMTENEYLIAKLRGEKINV
jgi:hypothetical protein